MTHETRAQVSAPPLALSAYVQCRHAVLLRVVFKASSITLKYSISTVTI